MLKLTLELWPYGDQKAKKFIKSVDIANDGSQKDFLKYADYKVRVRDNPHTEVKWKQKYVTDYPRTTYDALYLTYLVLRKLVHEENLPLDAKANWDKEAST